MALGNSSNQRPPVTYVQLGRGENAGFRHNVGMDGEGKRIVNTYDHVTGIPSALYLKEELIYAVAKEMRDKGQDPNAAALDKFDKDQKRWVANLHLRDSETKEVVSVSFDAGDSLGGKIVGMVNAQLMAGQINQEIKLRTFYAPPRSKYNETDKGHDSVNMAPFDPANPNVKHPDIKPVFLNDEGMPLLKDDGSPQPLPMGVVTGRLKGKDIWDFSARNEIILGTALTISEYFQELKNAEKNTHSEHVPDEDEILDLNEAALAAAATPQA